MTIQALLPTKLRPGESLCLKISGYGVKYGNVIIEMPVVSVRRLVEV